MVIVVQRKPTTRRKPMPRPSKAIASRLDRERRRRFNAYLRLWKAMQDKEEQCQA